MKRIAVIGGGISGLSAAWHLQQKGFAIELFESSNRLGGILGTIRTGPYMIERAADNFATLDPEAKRWCEKLGVLDQWIPPTAEHRRAMVVHRGRPIPIPAGFSLVQPTRFWPLITTPVLSVRGKLRALGEYFVPARKDPTDESLQSFAIRRLGREVFDRLVEPIVGGIFTADPERLSMQATLPQFVEMERDHGGLIRGWFASRRKSAAGKMEREASGARYAQFLAPRDGMEHWIEQIADKIGQPFLHTQSQVLALESTDATDDSQPTQKKWKVRWARIIDPKNPQQTPHSETQEKIFDGVILATPAAATANLLEPLDRSIAESISKIRYASSAVVAMIVKIADIKRMPWCFGIVVPAVEKRPVLAISFSSLKYPGRVPEGELLVRIFLGGSSNPAILEKSDQELEAIASKQLSELTGWEGSPSWSGVIRWMGAMPQYDVGHRDLVARIFNETEGRLPGIALSGAAYKGVGIPQCIRSGREGAEWLGRSIQPS